MVSLSEADPFPLSGKLIEWKHILLAGGLVLGEVLGDADLAEILGGAAAGAAVGNVTADRVVVTKPDDPINLYP